MKQQCNDNLELISSHDKYEKHSYEKYQTIKEVKSILDSEFYLIRKIGESSSGKVYLGIHKDSLKEQSDDIIYYSVKIINKEKIDLNIFKNEIELLKKINHKNVCKIFSYGCGPKIYLNKTKNKKPKEY